MLDPNGLPLTLLREADGTPTRVSVGLPGGRTLNAHVWKAQVGRVPLLLLDSHVEDNDEAARGITDRLYGGGGEHRLQQEMLLGIGGVRALRAWGRLSGAPAPEVYHTNEGHAGFLGLERIRELVTESGLSFEEALEAVRAGTVFTTHTPVPAGIDRFGRDQIETYFGGDNAVAGVPVDKILALGAESYPGGDHAVFNMARDGAAAGPARQRRLASCTARSAGTCSTGCGPASTPTRCRSPRSPTACTRPPGWTAGWSSWPRQRVGPRWSARRAAGSRSPPSRARRSGQVRRQLRSSLVEEARRRLRASWLKRGASPAELGWIDSASRPRRADHRVRPPGADLQAAHADAARPRPAAGAAAAPAAAGAARHRRQVAPGRRRGQAADPADGALRRRPRGAAPHRLPAQLRHRHGAGALPRLRRLAEQPAAPVRGLRHLGDEGRAERRAEPVDPRRLVGRVVRRRERLGDPHRRRRRRPESTATTSRPRPCTT